MTLAGVMALPQTLRPEAAHAPLPVDHRRLAFSVSAKSQRRGLGTAALTHSRRKTRSAPRCAASDADSATGPVQRRRVLLSLAAGTAAVVSLAGRPAEAAEAAVALSDEEWKQLLTPGEYRVLRQAGTELPFSSPLNKENRLGTFKCAGCGSSVYSSAGKFDSGTGWPSFFEPLPGAVNESQDNSIPFLPRTEISCKTCGGHLGHVFRDGPPPTGLRYCMNGIAMAFEPAADA